MVPRNKEKHFLAKGAIRINSKTYICALEAVRTKRIVEIDWRELKDGHLWLNGWHETREFAGKRNTGMQEIKECSIEFPTKFFAWRDGRNDLRRALRKSI